MALIAPSVTSTRSLGCSPSCRGATTRSKQRSGRLGRIRTTARPPKRNRRASAERCVRWPQHRTRSAPVSTGAADQPLASAPTAVDKPAAEMSRVTVAVSRPMASTKPRVWDSCPGTPSVTRHTDSSVITFRIQARQFAALCHLHEALERVHVADDHAIDAIDEFPAEQE